MFYQEMEETYIGEFKNGVYEGQGILKFFNGEIYNGGWKDGLMHGNGLYSYPDGSELFGGFENGIKINGKLKYANGDLFTGEFSKKI